MGHVSIRKNIENVTEVAIRHYFSYVTKKETKFCYWVLNEAYHYGGWKLSLAQVVAPGHVSNYKVIYNNRFHSLYQRSNWKSQVYLGFHEKAYCVSYKPYNCFQNSFFRHAYFYTPDPSSILKLLVAHASIRSSSTTAWFAVQDTPNCFSSK